MNPQRPSAAAEPTAPRGAGLSAPARLAMGAVVSGVAAFVCLMALSLTGWGFESDPARQLLRDLPQLVVSAVAGAAAVAALAWALFGRRRPVLATAAILGTLPAVVMTTAYFTHRY